MDDAAAEVTTLSGLGRLLRELRRRQARRRGTAQLTYRELAAATGWSHGIIGEYLAGRVLPPTDRFDVLIGLLGAGPAELGRFASARDRVDEARRAAGTSAPAVPRQLPARLPAFTGRAETLAELDRWLAASGHGLIVVSGTAGVGKPSPGI